MLVYPSGIELSSSTLRHLARLLSARRLERKTRWRRLTTDRQALLILAHLRCGHTYAQLAAGFGIGIATVNRYADEAVDALSTLAPDLATAVRAAGRKAFVILDGTLLAIDRVAADRLYYSGKHKRHGMNVQVIADPFGRLLWASPALPGTVHDIRAARTHGVIAALTEADLRCWADKGYQGAGGTVLVPFRGPHARIRALGEQAMATLKAWRLLRKLRCSTTRVTDLGKAVLTLHPTTAS
ncbi:IS5/IS1182 family transposase [Streptomyces griseoluteus]|uniref:IS5/IS1182 family transposase n=1 Tax=Streptomyces griseoluteus TaxID=29306 RepID=A0A4Z1CYX6_STRGP|nr:transposase family protein [Streptomyces griseoluteus]TGN74237.1 IS5/IS1182 family transposase [Streptomyces griseoluteus]GHF33403.1 IS5 family transposase [Streptomyces griseoluteus]